jgi:hypothetical protein
MNAKWFDAYAESTMGASGLRGDSGVGSRLVRLSFRPWWGSLAPPRRSAYSPACRGAGCCNYDLSNRSAHHARVTYPLSPMRATRPAQKPSRSPFWQRTSELRRAL